MINCIIIDDEPLAIRLLENHISKIEGLKIIATAKNAVEAYKILQLQPVDLMFLDIHMPDLNGIEFLKSLRHKPKTIFTTAYREFALDGFELEAVDYLLKPITFERFFKSVDRVLRNVIKESEDNFVIFKSEGFYKKILLKDILYCESTGNNLKVILNDHTIIVSKTSISEIAANLQKKGFIRIHRSFIINKERVTAVSNNEVLLGKISLSVGRSFKEQFDEFARLFLSRRIF